MWTYVFRRVHIFFEYFFTNYVVMHERTICPRHRPYAKRASGRRKTFAYYCLMYEYIANHIMIIIGRITIIKAADCIFLNQCIIFFFYQHIIIINGRIIFIKAANCFFLNQCIGLFYLSAHHYFHWSYYIY